MAASKNKTKIPFEPDYAVAPGRTLLETIESLGIDQNELAERTGLTPKTVNLIIKGKAPLTQQTAMLLERVTSVPARIWNNLECNFREQLARIASHKQLEKQLDWLKRIPTKELVARGVIPATSDRVTLLDQTLKFFGVASVEAWYEGWSDGQFAFRKSHQVAENDGKLASWLRLAELHGQQCTVSRFNKELFGRIAKSVRELTHVQPEVFVPQLIDSFASAGVALCLVPEIPGAKINGAAKWLSPEKALIAVNLRGKKNDIFWFTLFMKWDTFSTTARRRRTLTLDTQRILRKRTPIITRETYSYPPHKVRGLRHCVRAAKSWPSQIKLGLPRYRCRAVAT